MDWMAIKGKQQKQRQIIHLVGGWHQESDRPHLAKENERPKRMEEFYRGLHHAVMDFAWIWLWIAASQCTSFDLISLSSIVVFIESPSLGLVDACWSEKCSYNKYLSFRWNVFHGGGVMRVGMWHTVKIKKSNIAACELKCLRKMLNMTRRDKQRSECQTTNGNRIKPIIVHRKNNKLSGLGRSRKSQPQKCTT